MKLYEKPAFSTNVRIICFRRILYPVPAVIVGARGRNAADRIDE
jgi:hypothetical protein